jgi:hypothetical protein
MGLISDAVAWLLRGNVPSRLALVATLLTWVTIPLLWAANDAGNLSLVELFWVLAVVAAWLLALAGLVHPERDTALALSVAAWSSVIPFLLAVLLVVLIAINTGGGGANVD